MAETPGGSAGTGGGQKLLVALAWLYVGVPLAWGVAQTLEKCIALFK